MKASELREKTIGELNSALLEMREEQFKLRMQRATGQLNGVHAFKNVRRNIARVNTLIKEKQGNQ